MTSDTTNVVEFAHQIVELVKNYRGGVSFVNLSNAFPRDFRDGDYKMMSSDRSNIVLWNGVSQLGADAINYTREKLGLEMVPTQAITYLIDGITLNIPLVKSNRNYKKPHWLPVTFSLAHQK